MSLSKHKSPYFQGAFILDVYVEWVKENKQIYKVIKNVRVRKATLDRVVKNKSWDGVAF